jgi:hypothetical protein
MIEKMNQVGISKIVKFAKENHPRENVERCMQIIRLAAKHGYVGTAMKINTSNQYVDSVVVRYYGYALEVEKNVQ